MERSMIRVRNVSIQYGPAAAMHNVSLDVARGECLLISGPSGCGKSTLARALCGLIPHALPAQMRGRVEIDGRDTLEHPLPVLAQQVGIVFQNPSTQLFHLRVADEVAFGPRNLGLDEVEVQSRVDWALAATGLTALGERKPGELSGGQKQCLAIAAVLAMRPQVLILDEPTASLDVPSTRRMMDTLAVLRRQRMTIVLVEHRLAEAAHLADRLLLMQDGQIVADGRPLELLADAGLRKRMGLRRPVEQSPTPWTDLIQPNGANGRPSHLRPAGTGPSGHRSGCGTRPGAMRAPLLTMEGVSAGYNRRPVIHDVSLALHPGDFVALVGDNGAGKSTLALAAAGLLKPLRGRVQFDGGKRPRPGLDVALLFQDPSEQLLTDTVNDEVAFGPLNYGCYDGQQHQRTLQEAGLWALTGRRPLSLSVGQQQRTALAACLALRPRLLILDEPTLGQDWGHLARLMNFLQELGRQGAAILLISHDYKLVHHYAHRAVLMEAGRITMQGYLPKRLHKEMSDEAVNA